MEHKWSLPAQTLHRGSGPGGRQHRPAGGWRRLIVVRGANRAGAVSSPKGFPACDCAFTHVPSVVDGARVPRRRHAAAVTRLRWRPHPTLAQRYTWELASCGEDHAVCILPTMPSP